MIWEGATVMVEHPAGFHTVAKLLRIYPAHPNPVILVDCTDAERCGRIHLVSAKMIKESYG